MEINADDSSFLIASSVLVLALALPVAASAQHNGGIDVPVVPSNLVVVAGHEPFLLTRAYGTQNYFCQSNATWKLYGPQATLYPGNVPFQIATHVLSPNPEKQGLASATWMHSHDGSAVWAAKIAEAPADGAIQPIPGRQARDRDANRARLQRISAAAS